MVIQSNSNTSPQFEKLLRRLRSLLSRRREFARMTLQEVDEIARELGLSASDLHALSRERGAPDLLRRRLAHAGVSDEALARSHSDVLRDLQRVCGLCREKARCAADLAREKRASPAKYCPNELTLSALGHEINSKCGRRETDVDHLGRAATVVSFASLHSRKGSS